METKKVIIIGGSAGSVNVLLKILSLMDITSCLPVILLLHRKATDDIALSELLQFKSKLEVLEVEDKMLMMPDKIYLAPANYHLLIENNGVFCLDYSEKINYSRPNIDACIESFVEVFGDKVIGILLTGANNDGAAGIKLIHDAGGYTILQSPETCEFPSMPINAGKLSPPDKILTPEEIAGFISNLKNTTHEKLFSR